jgi:hypothetical protein
MFQSCRAVAADDLAAVDDFAGRAEDDAEIEPESGGEARVGL